MPEQQQPNDVPQLKNDDQLEVQQSTRAQNSPESTTGSHSLARTAIAQMSGTGPNAEDVYQATVQELAADPQAAVSAIAEMYGATPEDQYTERWSQIHLLSELSTPAALAVFEDLLSTPIPPEKMPGMVVYSTVGEETIIRTTAVEGIAKIAARGNNDALEMLRKYVQHESFSVRRAAIQTYIEIVGPESREELRASLPAEDHFILDIRRANVQEIPQARPERSNADTLDQAPPPSFPFGPTIDK